MSIVQEIIDTFAFEAKHGGFTLINGAVPWDQRFGLYRRNYGLKQKMVEAGLSSWMEGDPYQIADWASLFTPIEAWLWSDIRRAGLPLWPQLPVGRFFVDFGNPVKKIAVECDGAQFHKDKAKDAARDAELEAQGWTVHRIEGWQCRGEAPDLDPEMDREQREERARFIEERTPARLIEELKWRLLTPRSAHHSARASFGGEA